MDDYSKTSGASCGQAQAKMPEPAKTFANQYMPDWSRIPKDVTTVALGYADNRDNKVFVRPPAITLHLTDAQAQALAEVTARIGGNEETTARGRIHEISMMLSRAGFRFDMLNANSIATGSITFVR